MSDSHERIGRYEVLRKIATGGMAELFLAKQVGMEGFEKVVAIKRILAHLAHDDEFINMFRDEARIVAKLSHPNIVQIYDLGKSDESYFIAMEYIPGRNLSSIAKRARLKEERLPSEYIARCVAQACEGLYYAHTRKDIDGRPLQIVHRDVSPQNIIVSFSGAVKLVDFGIAKAATKIAHTRAGVLKGKYAYMSPEQIRGEVIDARSDLFAVGIVLYELLAGRRPFEKDNSIQTLKAIVQDRHRDCRELNPDIPDGMAKIIDRALEKDPDRRFQDAQEIQVALEDFVSSSPMRCNNITISKWVQGLFAEELSKERGGTMVFQGVGEVILPDVDEEPKDAEGSGPEPSQPLPLARGRGGGSVDTTRPPIPAPSNSLIESRQSSPSWSDDSQPERRSLIEEQVLSRSGAPPRTPPGGYDDDATVHALDEKRPPGSGDILAEDSIDRPLIHHAYDDSETEFSKVADGPDDTDKPQQSPPRGATAPSRPVPETAENPPITLDSADEDDDIFEEATVGFDNSLPGISPLDRENANAATISPERPLAIPPAETELAPGSWGDLSGSFEAEATIGADPRAWDDETANNDAYAVVSNLPSPVVESLDDDDLEDASDDMELAELYDDARDDDASVQGDATIAVPAVDDAALIEAGLDAAELEDDDFGDDFGDATIAGSGLAFDDASDQGFGEEATLFADDDALGDGSGGWLSDATIAGAPFIDDSGQIAAAEEEEEIEVPMVPEETVPAMDEEPSLPDGVDLSRNVDIDAATIAGVTSDFVEAGLGSPSHTYEPEPDDAGREVAPPRQDRSALGAIKLGKIEAAPSGGVQEASFSISEESTDGELDAKPEEETTGEEPISALDFEFEDDSAIEEGELPSAVRSKRSPEANQALLDSAQEEYSALVAPKSLKPAGVARPDMNGAMGIGSSNVPPASLSLSEMLADPKARPPTVEPESNAARSASVLGRQIREVVRSPAEVPPPVASPPPQMPPPATGSQGLAHAPPLQPEPPPAIPPGYEAPPPQRSRLLMAALIAVGVACLATMAYFLIEELAPPNQHLTIRTTPAGASVYVNSQRQDGPTPLTIKGLKPGVTYEIRLEREGFEPIERPVRLPPNRPLIWQIPLKPKPTVTTNH